MEVFFEKLFTNPPKEICSQDIILNVNNIYYNRKMNYNPTIFYNLLIIFINVFFIITKEDNAIYREDNLMRMFSDLFLNITKNIIGRPGIHHTLFELKEWQQKLSLDLRSL
jgi:hypothetical protein